MVDESNDSLNWRKATTSGASECVEVAAVGRGMAVRDSKNPMGGKQVYSISQFSSFLEQIKAGRFDSTL